MDDTYTMNDETGEYMSDDIESKAQWVWSPPVYIKGKPEAVQDLQRTFAEVVSDQRASKTEAANRCFLIGLEQLANDIDAGFVLGGRNRGVSKRYQASVTRKLEIKRLRAIYESDFLNRGVDAFTEWCESEQVPPETYEQVIRQIFPVLPTWREAATDWLTNTCLVDCSPKSTTTIKQEALDAGIIVDPVKDWTKLRVLASDLGLISDERGFWQLKN